MLTLNKFEIRLGQVCVVMPCPSFFDYVVVDIVARALLFLVQGKGREMKYSIILYLHKK